MKNPLLLYVLVACAGLLITSCSKDESYADQKKREREAINSFLGRDIKIMDNDGNLLVDVGNISVISEDQFHEQDSVTNLAKNEYVLFGNTGVYMQIVRKGVGKKLESGESKRVIARYLEYNILGDSLQTSNIFFDYATTPDIVEIANAYGTFTASFNIENGGGAMYRAYGSTEVPGGWLRPFTYINIGRQVNGDDEIAKVRLIVPHMQGTSNARNLVYPCFYEITFQQTRE